MTFDYQEIRTVTASIEVDDICNCCILTRTSLGEERYLYVKTDFGSTQIIKYGPIVPDINQLPVYSSYEYSRFDTNEMKIIKIIQRFVADANYAEIIDVEYMQENIRDYMENMEEY